MSRIVSFVLLLVILLAIAALFFKLMAGFLLPMFLAVLLVIMFGPLHQWFLVRCKGRQRPAALLTTASIMIIVMVPLAAILLQAGTESVNIYTAESTRFDPHQLAEQAAALGAKFGLALEAEEIEKTVALKIRLWLAPLALGTTQYAGGLIIGLGVMIVSLYYFLADGPKMVRAIMRLSPLDDKYEQQLVEEFANISRAVVIATLLSAVVQGILAGIGFYFAGIDYVFLLTGLTMLLAMVPFIGAAAVWVPASLWLFYSGHTWSGVFLAVYGAAIVSMADNVIKPIILHGRSNLHPLLALLSVLGGVQALGPIGIFVGPMVVVFFHALLNMLNTELDSMAMAAKKESGA